MTVSSITFLHQRGDPDADTQMLISTIDYNEFVGRIGVGKIDNGSLKVNQEVMIVNHHDPSVKKRGRITKLYTFKRTFNKVEVNEAGIGENCCCIRYC